MAGEGGIKRKAPLNIDYDELLDRDDEPPAELMITNAAGMPIPPVDGEEAVFSVNKIKILSDKEIIDKIAVWTKRLPTLKLRDGGAKIKSWLNQLEAERALRERLEGVNMVITDADTPTCNGPTNVISRSQAPPSKCSKPASDFGRLFSSQLEKEKTNKSFREESSTLNRSEYQKMRDHRSVSAPIAQKKVLTSRQTPFKCVSHRSVNTNQQQNNCEKRGSRDSNPSSHLSDQDAFCHSTKKDFGRRNLHSHSRRNNLENIVEVDEEEHEDDIVDETDQLGQSYTIDPPTIFSKDARVYYPSRDDPQAIEICYSDMECLAPESYLSSPIMNFYIRYLLKPTSLSPRMERGIHIFNTFFYEKLKQDVLNKNQGDDSFSKFRRWWKGVNIFEKAYIFLPIHENHHWSLVIISIPNKEDDSGPTILHLDSFRLHSSKSIFSNVKSFLVEEWNFLRKENVLPEPFSEHIWDRLSRRINEKVPEVPQQENGYDCGLFVLFFMERFIDEAPERLKERNLEFGRRWFKPEDASGLRRKIRNLLNEEFRNAKEDACILDS